jgi:hypothetical protein
MRRLLWILLFAGIIVLGYTRLATDEPGYRIVLLKASHLKDTNVVKYSQPYYLKIAFLHKTRQLKEKEEKMQLEYSTAINPIIDLKIKSTEPIDELHPAKSDISSLFDFHYIRTIKTKQGNLIKEGITVPLNDFTNTINQNESFNQLKELKLKLRQKPVLQSEHRFIVTATLKNGEVLCDSTSKIIFEGIRTLSTR